MAPWVRRRYSNKDSNHSALVDALERAGIVVLDMSFVGAGFPDVIVCRRGTTLLVEIKNPQTQYGKKGMNSRQKEWAQDWPAPVYVLKTLQDVEDFANLRDEHLKYKREATLP